MLPFNRLRVNVRICSGFLLHTLLKYLSILDPAEREEKTVQLLVIIETLKEMAYKIYFSGFDCKGVNFSSTPASPMIVTRFWIFPNISSQIIFPNCSTFCFNDAKKKKKTETNWRQKLFLFLTCTHSCLPETN